MFFLTYYIIICCYGIMNHPSVLVSSDLFQQHPPFCSIGLVKKWPDILAVPLFLSVSPLTSAQLTGLTDESTGL